MFILLLGFISFMIFIKYNLLRQLKHHVPDAQIKLSIETLHIYAPFVRKDSSLLKWPHHPTTYYQLNI